MSANTPYLESFSQFDPTKLTYLPFDAEAAKGAKGKNLSHEYDYGNGVKGPLNVLVSKKMHSPFGVKEFDPKKQKNFKQGDDEKVTFNFQVNLDAIPDSEFKEPYRAVKAETVNQIWANKDQIFPAAKLKTPKSKESLEDAFPDHIVPGQDIAKPKPGGRTKWPDTFKFNLTPRDFDQANYEKGVKFWANFYDNEECDEEGNPLLIEQPYPAIKRCDVVFMMTLNTCLTPKMSTVWRLQQVRVSRFKPASSGPKSFLPAISSISDDHENRHFDQQ